jgi:hypothetical protein
MKKIYAKTKNCKNRNVMHSEIAVGSAGGMMSTELLEWNAQERQVGGLKRDC